MAPKPPKEILPYRDSTGAVKYAPNPATLSAVGPDDMSTTDQPLITTSERLGVDEDTIQRFTATGKPLPQYKIRGMASWGGEGVAPPPQLLPRMYTDESIIPAIIVDYEPSNADVGKSKSKRSSLLTRLKGEANPRKGSNPTKVVYMPRGEYLKHFARDSSSGYTGTEPYKRWTEAELDETYAKYKPDHAK